MSNGSTKKQEFPRETWGDRIDRALEAEDIEGILELRFHEYSYTPGAVYEIGTAEWHEQQADANFRQQARCASEAAYRKNHPDYYDNPTEERRELIEREKYYARMEAKHKKEYQRLVKQGLVDTSSEGKDQKHLAGYVMEGTAHWHGREALRHYRAGNTEQYDYHRKRWGAIERAARDEAYNNSVWVQQDGFYW